MEIEGPLKIGIVTQDDSLDREIHLNFTETFRNLSLHEQGQVFEDYILRLKTQSKAAEGEN